jgi:MoaA/NifB/PqqE/SkfB family radical SAM enzyme
LSPTGCRCDEIAALGLFRLESFFPLSGGEPLTYRWLGALVRYAQYRGVKRIAISSNGSFPLADYLALIDCGVNDFSISLDACCSSFADKMAGVPGKWERVVANIRELAKRVYTTVGVVLTKDTASQVCEIVEFAHGLGVADIRIIPAAQEGNAIEGMIAGVEAIPQSILNAHPILRYRVQNLLAGRPVRGISEHDTHRCYMAMDDSVVCGGYHFACVIHMREHGEPIGRVGPNMRAERIAWSERPTTPTGTRSAGRTAWMYFVACGCRLHVGPSNSGG